MSTSTLEPCLPRTASLGGSQSERWLTIPSEDEAFETAEIMADHSLMLDLRESMDQMKSGDTVSWESLKEQLDL